MDRFNRFLLGLLGLLLLVAGALGLLVVAGILPAEQPSALYGRLIESGSAQPTLWQVIIAAVGILLLVLGLLLVRGQLHRPSGGALHELMLDHRDGGRTTVQPVAVARATADDLRRLPGVVGSDVRLVGDRERPRVLANLELGADADLQQVREAAERSYGRVGEALGMRDLAAETRLRPTGQAPSRVS